MDFEGSVLRMWTEGWESQEAKKEDGQEGTRRKVHVGMSVEVAEEIAQRRERMRVGVSGGGWA
jgi:hypothetical protein